MLTLFEYISKRDSLEFRYNGIFRCNGIRCNGILLYKLSSEMRFFFFFPLREYIIISENEIYIN